MNIFKQFQFVLQMIHNALIVYDEIHNPEFDMDDLVDGDIIESRDMLDENSVNAYRNYRDGWVENQYEYTPDDWQPQLTETESHILYWLLHHELPHNRYMKKPPQPNDELPDHCNDCDAICLAQNINDRNNCILFNEPPQPNNADQQIPDVKSGLVMTCVVCNRTLKQSEMNDDVCMDCTMTDIDDSGIHDLSDDCLTAIMKRSGYGDSKIIHHHIVDHEPLRHNETVMQYKIICIFDELNENEYQLFGTVFVSMINHKWELQF